MGAGAGKARCKRAGNPRWISTWDARKPWLRLAIDHVMIGSDFETVQAEVMPPIGSDHYALFTVVGVDENLMRKSNE